MQPVPEVIKLNKSPSLTLGVVSDTHVPDRVRGLHPALLDGLRRQQVDVILHAGDISSRRVLQELESVAPVYAVRGNRDLLMNLFYPLPGQLAFEINGVSLKMIHGQGNFLTYIKDKWYYMWVGYRLERYTAYLLNTIPDASVVVFGHTHRPVNFWKQDVFLFNPGASGQPTRAGLKPTFGVLRISADARVESEIVPLEGSVVGGRQWIVKSNELSTLK